ncbi:hypothetical protein Hdeb2414_s0002g00075381 [Helianthus debilis subsp. tardiflorus]
MEAILFTKVNKPLSSRSLQQKGGNPNTSFIIVVSTSWVMTHNGFRRIYT